MNRLERTMNRRRECVASSFLGTTRITPFKSRSLQLELDLRMPHSSLSSTDAPSPGDSTNASRLGPSRPSRRRRAALLALKLSFVVASTLVLVEVGLRVCGIWPVSASVEVRDERHLSDRAEVAEAQRRNWIPWPTPVQAVPNIAEHPCGFIEIRRNSLSLREDEETSWQKRPGSFRILCLGDSHTDGVCWNPESYPNQLEQLLVAKGLDVEVLNAGFSVSSSFEQLWAYEQVYRDLRPDLIVVGIYAGNDLIDLLRPDAPVRLKRDDVRFVVVDDSAPSAQSAAEASAAVESSPRATFIEAVKQPFRDYSSTYHALARIQGLRRFVRGRFGTGDPYRDRLELAQSYNAAPIWQGLNQAYYFQHHPEDWDEALARQAYVLERFRKLAEEDGTLLRFAVIPTLRQIEPEFDSVAIDQARLVLQLNEFALATDERACEAIRRLVEQAGFQPLDLRPALTAAWQAAPEQSLYYRFDHHLNLHGNSVVARELANFLAEDVKPKGP